MKAIILAAGRGSRMLNKTDEIPKSLCMFNGKTLLNRQISALSAAGIREIAIVCGYMKEKLEKFGLTLIVNESWNETNMMFSLMQAKEWISEDDIIISYSDIFYTEETVKALINDSHDITITYDPNWIKLWSHRFANPLSDAESFVIDDDRLLQDIGRRIVDIEENNGQFTGLYKIRKVSWSKFVEVYHSLDDTVKRKLDTTGFFQTLLEQDIRIHCIPVQGPWGEADSQRDLALYEEIYPEI